MDGDVINEVAQGFLSQGIVGVMLLVALFAILYLHKNHDAKSAMSGTRGRTVNVQLLRLGTRKR